MQSMKAAAAHGFPEPLALEGVQLRTDLRCEIDAAQNAIARCHSEDCNPESIRDYSFSTGSAQDAVGVFEQRVFGKSLGRAAQDGTGAGRNVILFTRSAHLISGNYGVKRGI